MAFHFHLCLEKVHLSREHHGDRFAEDFHAKIELWEDPEQHIEDDHLAAAVSQRAVSKMSA